MEGLQEAQALLVSRRRHSSTAPQPPYGAMSEAHPVHPAPAAAVSQADDNLTRGWLGALLWRAGRGAVGRPFALRTSGRPSLPTRWRSRRGDAPSAASSRRMRAQAGRPRWAGYGRVKSARARSDGVRLRAPMARSPTRSDEPRDGWRADWSRPSPCNVPPTNMPRTLTCSGLRPLIRCVESTAGGLASSASPSACSLWRLTVAGWGGQIGLAGRWLLVGVHVVGAAEHATRTAS